MRPFLHAVLLALLAVAMLPTAQASPADRVHVVYHVDAGIEQATAALRNIRNQLEVDPEAAIVVVGIGDGVDFMLRGSKTKGGYPFDLMIEELQGQGVLFEACGNTLGTRKIDAKRLVEGVVVVRSGMAELARLQVRDGYAYIKP
ncbi:MAG TPA: DsrE family protein [Dokdonella sp.]|nr:DsrE family protein [Dokdonella sp.]